MDVCQEKHKGKKRGKGIDSSEEAEAAVGVTQTSPEPHSATGFVGRVAHDDAPRALASKPPEKTPGKPSLLPVPHDLSSHHPWVMPCPVT